MNDGQVFRECDMEFKNNQKVLIAIGDETRQAILKTLIEGPQNPGMRVGEIRLNTHLSRPAVSHHLKILKDFDFDLSEEEMDRIRQLDTGKRYSVNPTGYMINPIYVQLMKLFVK
ncbi:MULTISPECIES: ArsR/SmtB family transcription factor [Paenibacillus]|uniref:ArsR/SmtB family transcription factor n=1 Tax=Paenibacillus TaxID=44249 RepID=UPI00188D7C27|nr:ArsR family transcriptional regulator [Paenibacillus lautus]